MRLMEAIRRKGQMALTIFLVFFLVSVFAGLGVSGFFGGGGGGGQSGKDQPMVKSRISSEGPAADAVMLVNGRPVSQQEFTDLYIAAMDRARGGGDDPWNAFYAYGSLIEQLTTEQVLLGKAEELGVTVAAEDLEKAKSDAITDFIKAADKSSGNVVGDLTQKLSAVRERKRAFAEFLERMAMTEEEWTKRARRELLMDNTRKKFQEQADKLKKTAAEAKKAQVDAALKNGTKFADASKQFSEDATAEQGGDIGSWVGRGLLFDEKVADAVFATPIGQMTEWFDIPAGFQRFEIYEKKEAAGPEFEKEKPALIEKIKQDQGKQDDKEFKPTEDEIKKAYEAVKFRQILLKTTDDGAGDKLMQEYTDAATVEINDPTMLAYQALLVNKLQPVAGVTYDDLVQIAKNAVVGEGYKFELIKPKLEKGRPAAAAGEDEAPAAEAAQDAATAATPAAGEASAEATDAAPADAAAEGGMVDPADSTPIEDPEQVDLDADADKIVPQYALAIGLFTKAQQDLGEQAGFQYHYFIAKTYSDWLQDEEQLKDQPVDRDAARKQIDEHMQLVLKSQEYNSAVHALNGLNLAWLDKKEDARKSLELAEKYAPKGPGAMWLTLRKAYDVLGDTAKAEEIQKKSDALMQEYFQQQFSQQMQQQQGGGGGGQSVPIQIPAG